MAVNRKPLLAPGNEAEWARINRADAEQLRASNLALTPTERLELGQKLSQQAVSLLAASVKAGGRPQDRVDLEELEAIHGDLPVEPIPGLDS